jgi:hypothetical protein
MKCYLNLGKFVVCDIIPSTYYSHPTLQGAHEEMKPKI